MSILTPSGLETADYGSDGWNAIYTDNFEKINKRLGQAMTADPTEDVEIVGTTNDDTKKALQIKNSDDDEIISARNDKKVLVPSSIEIGGATNYVAIDGTNAVRLHGDATTWEDLRIDGLLMKDGSVPPSFAKWLDNGSGSSGVYINWFAAGSINEVHFSVQMPHNWKEGSSIYPHVHWVPKTNSDEDPASQKVRWGLEYTAITNIGVTFGNTNIIYAKDHSPSEALVANRHYITSFDAISMTGKTISTVFACRLFRDATHSEDTYEDEAGFLYFDIHYEVDSLGSNSELAKD